MAPSGFANGMVQTVNLRNCMNSLPFHVRLQMLLFSLGQTQDRRVLCPVSAFNTRSFSLSHNFRTSLNTSEIHISDLFSSVLTDNTRLYEVKCISPRCKRASVDVTACRITSHYLSPPVYNKPCKNENLSRT